MTRSPSVAASLNQTPKEKWRRRLLEVLLDAGSRRNLRGARDLQYSAAPGGLLRNLQHDLQPRPYRCGVCGSEAVLRVEPILNHPDPPGRTSFPIQFSRLRAVA